MLVEGSLVHLGKKPDLHRGGDCGLGLAPYIFAFVEVMGLDDLGFESMVRTVWHQLRSPVCFDLLLERDAISWPYGWHCMGLKWVFLGS